MTLLERYSSRLICAMLLLFHFKTTNDMLHMVHSDAVLSSSLQQDASMLRDSFQQPPSYRCNCSTIAIAGKFTTSQDPAACQHPAAAAVAKSTPRQKMSDSKASSSPFKPMVWTIHIPKTGGRSLREIFAKWMGQSGNCDMCATCAKKGPKIQDSYHTFYLPATKSVLGMSPDRPYNKTCRALDQEASLPLLWETRKELGVPADLPWYVTALLRNPVSRFVSAAKTMVRAKQCDDKKHPVSTAIQYVLDGHCTNVTKPYWTYHADQFHYYFNASFTLDTPFAPPVPFPKQWTSMAPLDQWNHIQQNVNLIVLTEYMHVSECLLAIDLAKAKFVSKSHALDTCNVPSGIMIGDSKPFDPELDPFTTAQLVEILTKAHPLDPILYPHALMAFRNRLKDIATKRTIFVWNDFPNADKLFVKDLSSLGKEIRVWFKVSEWLQAYHGQVRQGNSKIAALQELADRLDKQLTPDEKEIIAPSLGWGRNLSH